MAGEVFRLAGIEIWARKTGEEGIAVNELRIQVVFSDGRDPIEIPEGAEPQEVSSLSLFDGLKTAVLDELYTDPVPWI